MRKITVVLGGLLLAALVIPNRAGAVEPLVFEVARGDSVGTVVGRQAERIRSYIPRAQEFRTLSAPELAVQLLRRNLGRLPHGIHPGNLIQVHLDGTLEVVAGKGQEPQPFASASQMRRLAATVPEAVHAKLKDLAHQGSVRMQVFWLAEDGSEIRIGDQTYTTTPGLRFVGRSEHFHVAGDGPPQAFNIPIWPFEGVPFSFPPNPNFHVTADGRVTLKRHADAALARLLASEELRAHETHYHVTRELQYQPWQKLIRLAADDAAEVRQRRIAVAVQVALLGEEHYINPRDFARDLSRIKKRIDRVWQGVHGGMTGPQMTFVVRYNAAIEQSGKLLHIGEHTFSAAEGLHFSFCNRHVHVSGDALWGLSIAVAPPEDGGEPFVFGQNAFMQDRRGTVSARRLPARLTTALQKGQLTMTDHRLHPTEAFLGEAFREIHVVTTSEAIDPALRQSIRTMAEAILRTELPLDSTQSLLNALAKVGRRVEGLRASLPEVPPAPVEP